MKTKPLNNKKIIPRSLMCDPYTTKQKTLYKNNNNRIHHFIHDIRMIVLAVVVVGEAIALDHEFTLLENWLGICNERDFHAIQ